MEAEAQRGGWSFHLPLASHGVDCHNSFLPIFEKLRAKAGEIMADIVLLKTQPRQAFGSANAKRLRNQGMLPAVVYGHKEADLTVMLPRDELEKVVRKGIRVLELDIDGKTQMVKFAELQWDHLGKDILHADFQRVSRDEKTIVQVRIELRGIAPGIGEGGVIDQPIHNLTVECTIATIPEVIRVQIDKLHLGEAIHVKELTLPPDVVAKADPDAIVVQVRAQKVEAEAPAVPGAATAGETAEPEVIGKKVAEEEETEE
jgi:large subunit ribosomal protein L25